MLDEKIVAKLREKYSELHPLLFSRSVQHARSNGELFDIIDTVPEKYPIVWNDKENKWVGVDDIYMSHFLTDFPKK